MLNQSELNDIANNFPVISQTSDEDKLFLLTVLRQIKNNNKYFKYLEIGSFLGGSLSPFLLEPLCEKVVAIDQRQRQQPDERGIKYDYNGITNQTMFDNLRSYGIDTSKLEAYDGSIDAYPNSDSQFDVIYIDGEHTDVACFRDFIYAWALRKEDSIILFHDSSLIYKALQIIRHFLTANKVKFIMAKNKQSEVTAVLLGKYLSIDFEKVFGEAEDWDNFYKMAEEKLLKSTIENRLDVRLTYVLKDIPVIKAY